MLLGCELIGQGQQSKFRCTLASWGKIGPGSDISVVGFFADPPTVDGWTSVSIGDPAVDDVVYRASVLSVRAHGSQTRIVRLRVVDVRSGRGTG